MRQLQYSQSSQESMAINELNGTAVVISASGMAESGRIRHHLRHNLWRREASVIFVGYAAGGTLARQIIEGAEVVKVLQEEVAVNAQIHTIGGFSAHADQQELLSWHAHTGKPKHTFLVHGEEGAMQTLASHLTGTTVVMPKLHQSFDL